MSVLLALDLLGVFVLAAVTALGGGLLRDVLVGVVPVVPVVPVVLRRELYAVPAALGAPSLSWRDWHFPVARG